jgi:hypothetical protein
LIERWARYLIEDQGDPRPKLRWLFEEHTAAVGSAAVE